MRCELMGVCGTNADADDPLADFIAGTVDVSRFEERESYSLEQARAALQWLPRRLESLGRADLIVCTFPTVLCVLLNELFPEKALLFVAIANPLFAAPGCVRREDSTVRECESMEAREYLTALRAMLLDNSRPVQGVAAYTITAALVGFQVGARLPLAGKAGRYLPAQTTWQGAASDEVLLARSRFFEASFGLHFRTLLMEFSSRQQSAVRCVFQQDLAEYLSYDDMSRFRAAVILPQDLGLHKFTEHFAMAMPIWLPAREWAYRLQMSVPWGMVTYSGTWHGATYARARSGQDDKVWPQPLCGTSQFEAPSDDWPNAGAAELAYMPFFNAQTVPYPLASAAFWYEFSEFVAYPTVQTFGSIPELLSSLADADLTAISGSMRSLRAELWRTTRAVYAAAASELARRTA